MKFYKVRYLFDPRVVLNFKKEKGKDLLTTLWDAVVSEFQGKRLIKCNLKFNEVSVIICDCDSISEEAVEKGNQDISKALDVGDILMQVEKIKPSDVNAIEDIPSEDKEYLLGLSGEEESGDQSENDANDMEPASVSEEETEDIFETVKSLVSMNELKSWVEEMEPFTRLHIKPAQKLKPVLSMSYLVSANDGNGCTTIFEVMGKVVARILDRKSVEVKEIFVEPDSEAKNYNVQSILKDVSYISETGDKLYVFALRVDKFQNNAHMNEWIRLLSALRNSPKALFIFVLPFLEKGIVSEMHAKISDIMPNRVLMMKPFGIEDYKRFFALYFEKLGMRVTDGALEVLPELVAEERSDGRFYGIDTIHKICDEILYEKFRGADENSEDFTTVTEKDTRSLLQFVAGDTNAMTGMKKLENLVSLEEVKNKIREIVATVKMQKTLKSSEKHSMHMMFSGPPGTGKTVVARILGQILREEKLLSVGGFYEVTRKDLVGSYVGHTAPKTAEVCQLARGSVLFIDEAYALDGGGTNDYGKEAISTLIAEMENYREDFVVIFAGYEKDLERLFDLNPGLRDRIPYRVHFASYHRHELQQIFYKMLPEEFLYDSDFEKVVSDYFENFSEDILNNPNFSNARFVRNLTERVLSKAYLRMQMNPSVSEDMKLIASDFLLAIADGEFQNTNQKKKYKAIGF